MRSRLGKALAFLLFIGVLVILLEANSKTLNLFVICLIAAFALVASATIVIRTFAGKPGTPYQRAGWGNPFSVLPTSWRRWLLDEQPRNTKRAG